MYKNSEIDFFKYMKKKVRSLLVPYISFGIISIILWSLVKGFYVRSLQILLWDNTSGIVISGALWFLTALFIADIIFWSINKYVYSKVLQLIIVIIISGLGCFFSKQGINLPWAINPSLVGIGFMYIGKIVKQNFSRKRLCANTQNKNIFFLVIAVMCAIVIGLLNEPINMRTGSYGRILLFWIDSLLWIFIILYISIRIEKIDNLLFKWIKDIGKNSITYVCLNQIILYGIGFFLNRIRISAEAYCIIQFVLGMSFLWIINIFFSKSFFKFLIGK